MPVSPEMAVDLAKRTLEIFLRAEQILLELVARLLARGGDTARPESDLLRIQRLRRDAQAVADGLLDDAVDATEAAVRTAYNRGVAVAGGQLADLGPSSAAVGFAPVGDHAVRALVEAAASRTRELVVPIVRVTEDAYRQAVVDAAAQVVVGTRTRRDASAEVVSKLAEAGLQFVDSRGRRWEMGAYAEMTVRTTAGQALVQGHLDRLREAGHDLVVVSDAPEECALCRPFEGRILSISGRTMGTVGMESPLGGTVTVSVRGSMAEAVAAGLHHPNCRHTVSLYIPGVSPRPLVQRTADPEGDELRRRQRALERAVRTRRRQLGALAVARKETAAALGRKTLPPTDPVEREYRRVRTLEQAARVRHDAFIAAHDRKAQPHRFNPVHR